MRRFYGVRSLLVLDTDDRTSRVQYVYLYFILYVPIHPGFFSPTLAYEAFGCERIKF